MIAIYPISANPPTFGHADILKRASQHFDQIYWVVAANYSKTGQLPSEVRLNMMNDYVDFYKLNNVVLDTFQGSIARYAVQKGSKVIIRGVRNPLDVQGEMDLATGYKGVVPDLEVFCLFSDPAKSQISSSLVRELIQVGENVDQYILPSVTEKLKGHM